MFLFNVENTAFLKSHQLLIYVRGVLNVEESILGIC